MANPNSTNYSRDGDQFHYTWAARRCLKLLDLKGDLDYLSIEGSDRNESASTIADEVLDVVEYYKADEVTEARKIIHYQLKHSTVKANDNLTLSQISNAITGFATKYREYIAFKDTAEFVVITNKPISPALEQTRATFASGDLTQLNRDSESFKQAADLEDSELPSFCAALRFEGDHEGFIVQAKLLTLGVNPYFSSHDADAPLSLCALVTNRATSQGIKNNTIRLEDVLRALKTSIETLYPAPSDIEPVNSLLTRECYSDLTAKIIASSAQPVIVHADGGVGKTVFAAKISNLLPAGSECILFDCFAKGDYRQPSQPRHQHRYGLVQIVNELASKGLCDVLIPSANATAADSLRSFLFRLKQSISQLRLENNNVLLVIVIDAADNSQSQASEQKYGNSFATDLLRESMPEGVRLVLTSRTHRVEFLNPPPRCLSLELPSFNQSETAQHLKRHNFTHTTVELEEFHHLSSQNPRVQKNVLINGTNSALSIRAVLDDFGPSPKQVNEILNDLFTKKLSDLFDETSSQEKLRLENLCKGLATLPPLIPIEVLATLASVTSSQIRSFATEIGRPLFISYQHIKFFDEPAETWFREQHRATQTQLTDFISTLKPLTSNSEYIAAALPALMLQAGLLDELITMALSDEHLPTDEASKIRISHNRQQAALKACLQSKRYTDAAKLAMKAAVASSSDQRLIKLIESNTDLAAQFLKQSDILDIEANRQFQATWMGSQYIYEASILSWLSELKSIASNKLSSGDRWLSNYFSSQKNTSENHRETSLSAEDICEMALAIWNLKGADACAKFLALWRPKNFVYETTLLLSKKLLDLNLCGDLLAIANSKKTNPAMLLAIQTALKQTHQCLTKELLKKLYAWMIKPASSLSDPNGFKGSNDVDFLAASVSAVIGFIGNDIGSHNELAELLGRHLPTSPPNSIAEEYHTNRISMLKAYALRATLLGRPIELADVANSKIKKELESKNQHANDSQDAREHKEVIGALLPWYNVWASAQLVRLNATTLAEKIDLAKQESSKTAGYSYGKSKAYKNEIAVLWMDLLVQTQEAKGSHVTLLREWLDGNADDISTNTLTFLIKVTSHSKNSDLLELAQKIASQIDEIVKNSRQDAEDKISSYILLSRAMYAISKPDAGHYFKLAIACAEKMGGEHLERFNAVLSLSVSAKNSLVPNPKLAYQLARAAHLTYDFVQRDKHFDWETLVVALAGICPSSAIAILSRWRDRGFGVDKELMPELIQWLVEAKLLSAEITPPLLGFQFEWPWRKLLEDAVNATDSKLEKNKVWTYSNWYMKHRHISGSELRGLLKTVQNQDLDTTALTKQLNYQLAKELNKNGEHSDSDHSSLPIRTTKKDKEKNWTAIFCDFHVNLASTFNNAYLRFKDAPPPWYPELFFNEMYKRVNVGSRSQAVKTVLEMDRLSLFELREFLNTLPSQWLSSPSVQSELNSGVKAVCTKHCLSYSIDRYNYYGDLSFVNLASDKAGVSQIDISLSVIKGLAKNSHHFDTSCLYNLVGLLAPLMNQTQAADALEYTLALYNTELGADDADGEWHEGLAPPKTIAESLAGYIWAGLARPNINDRWEAAHVVRGMFELGQTTVTKALLGFATGNSTTAFHDARYHFYGLHAQQWFLLALARAAHESPAQVGVAKDYLLSHTTSNCKQVMMRGLAAETLLTLAKKSAIHLHPKEITKLREINTSKITPLPASDKVKDRWSYQPERRANERMVFSHDDTKYWFTPLAEQFGISSNDCEQHIESMIWDTFGVSENGHWVADARAVSGFFKDGEASTYKNDYSKTDRRSAYLKYHALMVVAGQLVDTLPEQLSEFRWYKRFCDWLNKHDIYQNRPFWLSDYRDAMPLLWVDWKSKRLSDDWCAEVSTEDFKNAFYTNENEVAVDGRWSDANKRYEQTVNVQSALINIESSIKVLKQLQAIKNHHDYWIPTEDSKDFHHEPHPYKLEPWVYEFDGDRGLDRFDTWGNGIRATSPEPMKFICELLKLTPNAQKTVFSNAEENKPIAQMYSQRWALSKEPRSYDEQGKSEGNRLLTNMPFIKSMLKKVNRDLIVEVRIRRAAVRSRYERYDDKKVNLEHTRILLIRSDGSIQGLD